MISAETQLERYKIIEQAIKRREEARSKQDYVTADRIRELLIKMDVDLLDRDSNGLTYWRFVEGGNNATE